MLCTKKLIEHYEPEQTIAVFDRQEYYTPELSVIKRRMEEKRRKCEFLNYQSVIQGQYNWKFITPKPLDLNILHQMGPYIPQAIKMQERFPFVSSKFEEKMESIFNHIRYWNTMLSLYKIELAIFYDSPHEVYDYIIYCLCKEKKIEVRFLMHSPILGYSFISRDINQLYPQLEQRYSVLKEQMRGISEEKIKLDKDFWNNFCMYLDPHSDWQPYYMKKDVFSRTLAEKIEQFQKDKQRYSLAYLVMWRTKNICNRIKQNYKLNKDKKIYAAYWKRHCSKKIDLNARFIYFPLHMQPEMTTSPQAGWFTWQYLMIELLSSCLPKDVWIYVKENPKQTFCGRGTNYAQRLQHIANVKLLSSEVNTYELMDHCIAVATATGTALWESVFRGKPAIMFGSFITQYMPGVIKVENEKECKIAINKILSHSFHWDNRDLKIFYRAMNDLFIQTYVDCPPLDKIFSAEETSERMFKGFYQEIEELR